MSMLSDIFTVMKAEGPGLIKAGKKVGGKRAGKAMAIPLIGAAAAGSGLAIATSHPLDFATSTAFDTMMARPDMDNEVLGRDIKFRDLMFPSMASQDPSLWNSKTMGRAFQQPKNWELQAAQRNVEDGYASLPYLGTTMPVRRSVSSSGVYASGDIVLGGYNLRHG